MDTFLLRVFQRQVSLQCRFMLRAANDVNHALRQTDVEGTFYAIQNCLNAGAISRRHYGDRVGSLLSNGNRYATA
jgi:hypothetical protein